MADGIFLFIQQIFPWVQTLTVQQILTLGRMCVFLCSLPLSCRPPTPPPALVGGGARLGDWLAAPLSARLPGVLGAGRGRSAQREALYSKMLSPLLATNGAFVAERAQDGGAQLRAWQGE